MIVSFNKLNTGKLSAGRINRINKIRFLNNLSGYLFVSPWLIGFLIFTVGPMLISLFLAFTEFDYIRPLKWVNMENFRDIFTKDYFFWNSVAVTFKYVLIREPLKILIALFVALLLNSITRASGLFRTLLYMPTIIGSGVAVSVMWRKVMDSEGMLNTLLRMIGLSPVRWLNNPDTALYSLILVNLFTFGGAMLIFLAGLKAIPESLYESAIIDGAGTVVKFTSITLPMLSPVIFFNVIMGIIYGFQTFTSAFIMTQGGPAQATSFYMLNLYSQAFQYGRAGYASALAWILFIIILIFTILIFKTSDIWVFYESNMKSVKKMKKR